jgi:lipid A 4'-phosphatase
MKSNKQWLWDLIVPAAFLAGGTIIFWITSLDTTIESLFFSADHGWESGDQPPWRWLYDYGTIPAQVIAYGALGVFLTTYFYRRVKPCRIAAIFLVLVMLAGPGLLVNTIFKENWGRPRPLDLVQFSGEKEFLPVWVKGDAAGGQSFPSGHASMGFYWLTPFFVFRRTAGKWATFFLVFGISYGLLMGITRMVQGAHFPSDILWSFGFVYLTGLVFSRLLRPDFPRKA